MDLAVIALTFGAIFLVELPDKTFLATLVLSTKYRPVLVWLGVGLAFALQVTLAVALGQVVSFLPDEVVKGAAALLFLFGAVLLFREGRGHHEAAQEAAEQEDEIAAKATDASGWRAVLASFLVLFAAEWGDLSQLLTISLVAKYGEPVSVWAGALAALLTVSGLAVLVGRALLRWLKLHVLHYAGSAVCLLLAALTVVELVR
ncbi:TMEM165/GDT1 family protein [Nocardioides ferulae]|uniref:TMEM165/GDT1 family protein n=1 Tax=Nocardioides ferulae TaxID=2340821 RepID=UPI000EAEC510|nr:TMEM165/GDT1 family protein [Nocardioides ferulae]